MDDVVTPDSEPAGETVREEPSGHLEAFLESAVHGAAEVTEAAIEGLAQTVAKAAEKAADALSDL